MATYHEQRARLQNITSSLSFIKLGATDENKQNELLALIAEVSIDNRELLVDILIRLKQISEHP